MIELKSCKKQGNALVAVLEDGTGKVVHASLADRVCGPAFMQQEAIAAEWAKLVVEACNKFAPEPVAELEAAPTEPAPEADPEPEVA